MNQEVNLRKLIFIRWETGDTKWEGKRWVSPLIHATWHHISVATEPPQCHPCSDAQGTSQTDRLATISTSLHGNKHHPGTSLVAQWIKTPCFQCKGHGFDPWLRTNTPYTVQPKTGRSGEHYPAALPLQAEQNLLILQLSAGDPC